MDSLEKAKVAARVAIVDRNLESPHLAGYNIRFLHDEVNEMVDAIVDAAVERVAEKMAALNSPKPAAIPSYREHRERAKGASEGASDV
jgi:hypothetical protein